MNPIQQAVVNADKITLANASLEAEHQPPPETYLGMQDPAKVGVALAKASERPDWEAWVSRHNDDRFFALWMLMVDLKCQRFTGMDVYTFEDFLWHDAYSDGSTPTQAFRDFAEKQGIL